jgi:hypothetical protein
MNHLAYVKNDATGEIFDTKAKVLKLQSHENLSFYVSPELNAADWQKEPSLSLKEIYKLRAKQLRKQYDHITFYFSGGSDSITALNAFTQNDILLDEIVVYVNTDSKDLRINNLYALQHLRKINYKGYVNVVNLNYNVLSDILEKQTWKEYECSSGLLHSFYRWRIEFYEDRGYVQSTSRAGNVAHVFSGLYPTINRVDDNFYSVISIHSVIPAPCNPNNVQFFTSNDLPEVHIKQSHVLARHYAQKNFRNLHHNENHGQFKLTIRDEYVDIINTPKAKGITNQNDMTVDSQHSLLAKLYDDKHEFIHNYELVLQHFNSFNRIDLDCFSKKFFLFSVGESK